MPTDENGDRFASVGEAVGRVRSELDEAVDGTKQAGSRATKGVREAIDDLEDRITDLRKKRDEEP